MHSGIPLEREFVLLFEMVFYTSLFKILTAVKVEFVSGRRNIFLYSKCHHFVICQSGYKFQRTCICTSLTAATALAL